MFIGRKKELSFLERAFASDQAEFIAIYGRRRVGKTELLTEFCRGKDCIFYSSNETTDHVQLRSFSNAVTEYGGERFRFVDSFKDWDAAFSAISSLSKDKRLVVVIDEFPYMVKSNKSIPSVLQNLWDHKLNKTKLMLIISGSSMSFIENEILGYKNPLYGRTTGIYKLDPLSFDEAVQFFPEYSAEDKILAYSILGGIPHYLKQFDPRFTLEKNIETAILKRGTVLYNEVTFLLHEELREPAVYNAIIEAIALGNVTHNEIFLKTQIEKRVLSVYLKNLIDLGIIKREFPALSSPKEKTSSAKGNYALVDNLFRFWYAFCYPNISNLESGRTEAVMRRVIKPSLHNFAAGPFEIITIDYLCRKNDAEDLPFYFTEIGRWWGKVCRRDENGNAVTVSEELDILATDKERKHYIIGECKFRNEKFDRKMLIALMKKFIPDGNLYYYVFSLSGFTDAVIEESEKADNIRLVGIDELFY